MAYIFVCFLQMTTPYSLKIFLPDGNPDGIKTIEKSNWSGQGFVFPRALISEATKRKELNRTGVYILKGDDESSTFPKIYIGEADPLSDRLRIHALKKDFWTICYTFSSKDESLNKAHIQYIESRLVRLASRGKRCTLENGNEPEEPTLSEADRADAHLFLQEMLLCFPILGLGMFTNVDTAPSTSKTSEQPAPVATVGEELYIDAKGVEATGVQLTDGFMVKKGSSITSELTDSFPSTCREIRAELLKKEVVVSEKGKLVFTQDFVFNSPWASASVILGASRNGLLCWRNKNGVTLSELQGKE
jgi:hypothetical protein